MIIKERQMKEARRIARQIEYACDAGIFWKQLDIECPQITTYGEDTCEKGYIVYGDCPWTELEYDGKLNRAYIYIGRFGKCRIPQRVMYELAEVFNTLHCC